MSDVEPTAADKERAHVFLYGMDTAARLEASLAAEFAAVRAEEQERCARVADQGGSYHVAAALRALT
jgi:hypothetical protein